MSWNESTERERRKILGLCHGGLGSVALRRAIAEPLRKVVPFDRACFSTMDPATLLPTSSVPENLPLEDSPRIYENEYLADDVNKWSSLAVSPWPVGILSHATDGVPSRSARYRELLAPSGAVAELRAAATIDSACWGVIDLFREPGRPDFSAAEARFVAGIAPHLAEGLRTALVLDDVVPETSDSAPGLVVLDDRNELQATTSAGERWLSELHEAWNSKQNLLPEAVYTVANRARQIARQEGPGALPFPRARVRTAVGHWLVLHAASLVEPAAAPSQVAVVIEPARPAELAPLVIQAYGLTGREREVTALVLSGRSTREIAKALHLSPYTVQDYLKTVFEKFSVRSRRELVAKVFAEQYFPRILTTAEEAGSSGSNPGRAPKPIRR